MSVIFKLKSVEGTMIKLVCLFCVPVYVKCSEYKSSPSNIWKHVEVNLIAVLWLMIIHSSFVEAIISKILSCFFLKYVCEHVIIVLETGLDE